jgi:hypothetical protein
MANFAELWEAEPTNKFGGLNEDMSSRLQAANEAWKAKTGRDLPLTSGARSNEEQIKLFGKRESNPNLVARPGTSLHEKGMAADISTEVPNTFLDQFGLHRPFGSKDPVHVEINPKSSYAPKGPSVTVSAAPASNNFASLWEEVGDVKPEDLKQKPVIKQMGEMSKKLGKEFVKPLSEISVEDWKEKSLLAPAIEYTASSLGIPGFTEQDKKAAEEKLIKKGKSFVEGVSQFVTSPVETTKQVASSIAENPGKFAGEVVKGAIYDPEQFAAVPGGAKVAEKLSEGGAKAKAILGEKLNQAFPKVEPKTQMAGVGAAQVSNATILQDAISKATPELKAELQKLKPEEVDVPVLERQLEADSLPVPIKLSEGQATRSPQIFSEEMNSRGKNTELANRYNEQNKQLVENIDQIKENAAPEVYGTNHVENGQSLIDSYLDIDASRLANINAKYEALRDAAGGQFPIDGVAFADNALNSLKKNLKTEFLPDSIMRQVNAFKRGEPMTFEQFEAMRTNLASEMRKADRAGDGNAEFALSKVREALEDLPLTGETKELKALADEARAAAKERFDTLASDKAYKAAINGKVAADDFIQKFVIGGKKDDINTMVKHLGEDSQARQVMAAGVVNWLKSKAGILSDGSGTFSQKGFNKALESIDPKILAIVGPEVNQQLKALGRTARNIQERPAGAYVNESNTFTSAMAEKAKTGAELGLNYAIGGGVVPVGTMARSAIHNVKEAQKIKQSLKPGAGIKKTKLSDIGKE